VFDKNTFSFRPNKGQVIKAFDLAIGTYMKVGQTCLILARCDYAYGSKGLRMNGKVVVPPYATVQYEVTFIEVK
jgi:FKBP-type peptidyl-prolyl cis-trans isomerase